MNVLKLITPVNLPQEEENFFSSSTYHPRFAYHWNLDEIEIWKRQQPRYKALAESLIHQDADAITHNASLTFQTPWSEKLLQTAQEVLQQPLSPLPSSTVEELVKAQQTALTYLQIPYTIIVSDEQGFVARPDHASKRLIISNSIRFSYFSINSSVRHDMVHIIRYINGHLNGIKRSADYLPTEEGLATYMQDFGGNEANNSWFQHAAEYAVTGICRTGSLREAVDYLISIGFPKKLAWQRSVRHKFGFIDTSKAGDIMKPAMYFAHLQKIKRLPETERMKLFVGKISYQDIARVSAYEGKWSLDQLHHFFFEI